MPAKVADAVPTPAPAPANHSSAAVKGHSPEHARLLDMVIGLWLSKAIYVTAKLGLADLLVQGPRSSDDLAAATGSHPRALYRVMRALASRGFFTEVEFGVFALTPLGETLASDAPGKGRAIVIAMAGDFHWPIWGEFAHSVQTGTPASRKVYGMGVWEYYAQNPEVGQWFNEAMVGIHGDAPAAVVEAYDFAAAGKLVDVGGGSGNLLFTILKAYPAFARRSL